jgi:hypothetical protein
MAGFMINPHTPNDWVPSERNSGDGDPEDDALNDALFGTHVIRGVRENIVDFLSTPELKGEAAIRKVLKDLKNRSRNIPLFSPYALKDEDCVNPLMEEVFDELYSYMQDRKEDADAEVRAVVEPLIAHCITGGYKKISVKHPERLVFAAHLAEKYKVDISVRCRSLASEALPQFMEQAPTQIGVFIRGFSIPSGVVEEAALRAVGTPAFETLRNEKIVFLPNNLPEVQTGLSAFIKKNFSPKTTDKILALQKEYEVSDEEFKKMLHHASAKILPWINPLADWLSMNEKCGITFAQEDRELQKGIADRYAQHVLRNQIDEAKETRKAFPWFIPADHPTVMKETIEMMATSFGELYMQARQAMVDMCFVDAAEKEKGVPQLILELLKQANFQNAKFALDQFPLSPATQTYLWEEAREETLWKLDPQNYKAHYDRIKGLKFAGMPPEGLRDSPAARVRLINMLGQPDFVFANAKEFADDCMLNEEVKKEPIRSAVRKFALRRLASGSLEKVQEVLSWGGLENEMNAPDIQLAMKKGMVQFLLIDRAYMGGRKYLLEGFPSQLIGEDLLAGLRGHSAGFDGLVDASGCTELNDFLKFMDDEQPLVDIVKVDRSIPLRLVASDIPQARRMHLRLHEVEELKRNVKSTSVDLETGETTTVHAELKDFTDKFLSSSLLGHASEWQDAANIQGPFRAGAERFGTKEMLAFMDRPGLSRHDALHAFKNVIELQEKAGVDPAAFSRNILRQVVKDGATYLQGTAHHLLNSIVQSLDPNITKTLELAKKYESLPELQELLETYKEPAQVFVSWKSLKRFHQLANILKKKEILDQLNELKAQGKTKLYDFVSKLAFHPNSNVNIDAVMEFWRDPARFIDRADGHTAEEVQNRKKPSNYTHVPFLDLTAEDLRDAQVEGDLDRLQVFHPLEIRYTLPKNGEALSSREALDAALGSRATQRKPLAKNQKKLFGDVAGKLKGICSVQEYIGGHAVEADVEKWIDERVYDEKIGMPRPEEVTIVAKMNLKSDPDGVLAGDDTACCMPFGSGKKIVYDFNPDTTQFVLQMQTAEGTMRTIAQSVMTKDTDIGVLIPDVRTALAERNKNMSEVLPEKLLQQKERIAAADNVEVAANFKDIGKLIETVYRDFFQEYFARFGKEGNFNIEKLIIGMGYSDALTHLPKEPNTFAPDAPVGYSDKMHESVYVLQMGKSLPLKKEVSVPDAPPRLDTAAKSTVRGVSDLDFSDTLRVAYLEGKLYSDNQSLITYLHNIENALIGIAINNNKKKRPNMCMKYEYKDQVAGYILAYEGAVREEDLQNNAELSNMKGKSVIYIADLAADTKKSAVGGGKITQAFLQRYATEYLKKGTMMPIFLQAREQTSYRMFAEGHFQRHLEKLKADMHEEGVEIDFIMRELPTYPSGADTMHPIVIEPVLVKAKERAPKEDEAV